MTKKSVARLKNIIIITLFLTSIIQVGILWEAQNHGLPTSFLSAIFSKSKATRSSFQAAENLRGQYFLPNKIVITEGFDSTYWVVDHGSQDFSELWAAGKDYLKGLLNNSIVQGEPQVKTTSTWFPEIFSKAAIVFDLKAEMPKELIAFFLSSSNSQNLSCPNKVNKIIISPMDDVNISLNTIYLINNEETYKYTVLIKNDEYSKQNLMNIIDKYAKNQITRDYRSAKFAFNGKIPFKISQDLLLTQEGEKYEKIKSMVCEPPELLKVIDPDVAAEAILGDEKFSYYNTRSEEDKTIEFRNFNNSYKFNQNGIFEYKYLQNDIDSLEVNVDRAFENAVKFMEVLKPLIKGADLQLTGINQEVNSDSYEFTFDYKIGNFPIFTGSDNQSTNKGGSNNAVKIAANNKRVIRCVWLLKSFSLSKEKLFNVKHDKLLSSLPEELKDNYNNKFSIKDISIGYKIQPNTNRQEHNPVWGITTLDGEQYTIGMESK